MEIHTHMPFVALSLAFAILLTAGCSSAASTIDSAEENAEIPATETAELVETETEPAAEDTDDILPYTYQEDVLYYNTHAERSAPYADINELCDNSDVVVIGYVQDSSVAFKEEKIYTVHTFIVEDVIKGSVSVGDALQVRERGAVMTYGEFNSHMTVEEKDFIDPDAPSAFSDDTTVVCGVNGHYPMGDSDHALLFLVDCTGSLEGIDGTLYGVVRTYDGKFCRLEDGTYSQTAASDDGTLITDDFCWKLTADDISKLKEYAGS